MIFIKSKKKSKDMIADDELLNTNPINQNLHFTDG